MNITLNFEKCESADLYVMVDVLRASTTINLALDKFKAVIPASTVKKAREIAEKKECVLAGERSGTRIEGFDFGNSPFIMKNLDNEEYLNKYLVLTTTNGTRIMKDMNSNILVGSIINAEAVAKACLDMPYKNIAIVMAGIKGNFAIEDYLGAGEILSQLYNLIKNDLNFSEEETMECFDEFAKSAIIANENFESSKKFILNSRSAKRLLSLGYKEDVEISLSRNITDNVAIYQENILRKYVF